MYTCVYSLIGYSKNKTNKKINKHLPSKKKKQKTKQKQIKKHKKKKTNKTTTPQDTYSYSSAKLTHYDMQKVSEISETTITNA